MNQVTVIGCGAMGRQIALQCALHGFTVVAHDSAHTTLQAAAAFFAEYLRSRVAKGRLSQAEADAALARVRVSNSLEDAARGAQVVIEAIVERYEPKATLFEALGQICDAGTLLCTNSSNIRASRLAAVTAHPQRVLNLHFFNPALVMELVEVVVHPAVPEEVIERALAFCREIGRKPVVLRKEIPGFIVNRIYRALTREAVRLVEEGYASAEDIDLAVTKGLGHPMGPLKLMDATGIDISYLARMDEYEETGDPAARPNELLRQMYERGHWGKKSGQGFYDYRNASGGTQE